jgi:hypothetical protein
MLARKARLVPNTAARVIVRARFCRRRFYGEVLMMSLRMTFVTLAISCMQALFRLPIWQLNLASCIAESPVSLKQKIPGVHAGTAGKKWRWETMTRLRDS